MLDQTRALGKLGRVAVKEVRIGLIGAGWMGKAHAVAYRNVPMVFGPEPAVPALEMVADVNPAWAEAAARDLGFARWSADWREVVADPRVDVVDIGDLEDALRQAEAVLRSHGLERPEDHEVERALQDFF
jgi:hypothetical protein